MEIYENFKKEWYLYYSFFLLIGCTNNTGIKKTYSLLEPYQVEVKWADMTLFITKNTFANSPTNASRAFGYMGLTMYETVVWSNDKYQSLESQVNGLSLLPVPEKGKKYNWIIALNAGQAYMLKNLYMQTSDQNKISIDSLANLINNEFAFQVDDTATVIRSITFGETIAKALFEWSKTDGGYKGYLHNVDPQFITENKPGSWKPPYYSQVVGHFALHPHWGENRTFLRGDSEIQTPEFIPHSDSKNSDCYKQFLAVYEKNISLTQQEKEIAMWWNDDPSETFTPPGHSYNLATIVVRTSRPDLVKGAETYARVGIAVADAFIDCWKWKYMFMSERPTPYINEFIDPDFVQFWPEPPFPAFPSGHSIQAAATATVLSDLYGSQFSITDDTYASRSRDTVRNVEYKIRHFNTFWQVAEETAKSRFYGGIHADQDNVAGLQKGKEIGMNINALNWYSQK